MIIAAASPTEATNSNKTKPMTRVRFFDFTVLTDPFSVFESILFASLSFAAGLFLYIIGLTLPNTTTLSFVTNTLTSTKLELLNALLVLAGDLRWRSFLGV
jgi:hypothetical protein